MEYKQRISPTSLLFEARHELRRHLALETSLIERIAQLPEDDFRHHTRESYQLGAGFAYMTSSLDEPALPLLDIATVSYVSEAYFAVMPRNRYIDESTLKQAHDALASAVLDSILQQDILKRSINVDPYEHEALEAFVEGYLTVQTFVGAAREELLVEVSSVEIQSVM